jgi:hypothetical protein
MKSHRKVSESGGQTPAELPEHGHEHAQENSHAHTHNQAPEPGQVAGGGGADQGRVVNTAIPDETRRALIRQLTDSAATRAVMGDILRESGSLDFQVKWSERGGYFDGTAIFIDRNETENDWFGTLAHEIVHMRNDLIGAGGEVMQDSREDYIRKQMTDEIESQAICFLALIQEGKEEDTAAGYTEFYQWMMTVNSMWMASGPTESQDQMNRQMIVALAKNWLEDKYRNVWTTSNTGVNYYDYWGDAWDRAHAN